MENLNASVGHVVTRLKAAVLPRGPLGARLIRGAFWSFVGTLLSYGLGFLASVVNARVLGVVGFGELGMINSTVASFGTIAGFGLVMTATKYLADLRSRDPLRAGRILGLVWSIALVLGGTVAVIGYLMAPFLARSTMNAPHLLPELRIGCGLIFLSALTGVQTGALSGFEGFKTMARVNLIRGVLGLPIMVAGVWFWGLRGAVWALVLVAGLEVGLSYHALQQETAAFRIRMSLDGTRSELPVVWRFSLPAFLGYASIGPMLWFGYAILTQRPGGYIELGMLGVANGAKYILIYLPGVVSSVGMPILSSLLGEDDVSLRAHRGVEIVNTMNQLALWPVTVLLLFLTGPFLALYGVDFEAARVPFVLVVGGTAIGYVGSTIGNLITASGFMWFGAVQNLGWGAILIFVTYLGADHGAVAIGAGTALAYCYLLLSSALYMQQIGALPPTLGRRVMRGGALLIVLMLVALVLPTKASALLALPLSILSVPICLYTVCAADIRSALVARVVDLLESRLP